LVEGQFGQGNGLGVYPPLQADGLRAEAGNGQGEERQQRELEGFVASFIVKFLCCGDVSFISELE